MKRLMIVLVMLMICACSQDCRITDENGSDNMPLIEGEYYCLSMDGVRTYVLGEYQLIDDMITFSDSIAGLTYEIINIEE